MRPAERACLLLAILPAALLALAPLPASLPLVKNASSSSSSSSNPGKGDSRDPQKVVASPPPPPPPPSAGNHSGGGAQRNPVLAMLRDLPALKAAVIGACAASACLMACLLFRVLRSKRRNKKPRKYDIITTPAERVEMAPLNEEDDEDEDATVFDIKYRSVHLMKKPCFPFAAEEEEVGSCPKFGGQIVPEGQRSHRERSPSGSHQPTLFD